MHIGGSTRQNRSGRRHQEPDCRAGVLEPNCPFPDHHIVPSRSPLLLAREVFQALAQGGNVADREVPAC